MKSTTNTIHGVRKGRAKPCDACRRRKVKCDGNAANGTTCSSCKSLKAACTYNGSRDTAGYIKNLELEVQRLKSTLGKVHAYHSGHGIGLDVGSPDTPNSHLRPNTPAEPPTVASSPVPGPSRTTPEEDIMAMLSDELMQLPPDIIPRASSAVPSSSFRVDVGVNPSELGTTSTHTPPPRSLSAPTTSTRRLSSIPAIHYTPTPSPTPSHHSSSSMYYTHIPGTSLLDDEPQPQWRIEDSLQMWSAPTRFAWEEWDSYTASISALTAGMPQPQTQPR